MIRVRLLKVTGNSMHPTLMSGVFVLLWRWQIFGGCQRVKVGDIVAVDHPEFGKIIKRISEIEQGIEKGSGVRNLRLRGDNALASVTEAQMGWIEESRVIGKVVYVVRSK